MMPQKGRIAVFSIITTVFILLLVWKYADLMLFGTPVKNNSISGEILIERGPILDRNGRILAIQTRLNSITAWMPNVRNKKESAAILEDILGLEENKILEKFESSISRYLYIKRKISPTESRQIEKIIEEGKLKGISLEPEFGRNYPEKDLASQMIGFTGIDNKGLDGIEFTYNDILSPSPTGTEDYLYGNQLFLTIDLNIQYFAQSAALKAYNEHLADSVIIVVMEAQTGDILSAVSCPGYNLNTFYDASEAEKQNRSITFSYEPGSVFKIFSIASFLELGGISSGSRFFCDGGYDINLHNGETESINCLGYHGSISTSQIIKLSCNSGAGAASESTDPVNFHQMMTRFGFGRKTNLQLPGESVGLLRNPDDWSLRSKPTLAMGQELNVTAIQMATAATVFANNGTLLEPHIVKKILSPEGKVVKEFHRTPLNDVVSPTVAKTMLQMMGTAMESGGTAWRAQVDGIRMSSKTGTAQLIDPATGKYSEEMFGASCLSIFPTNNPEIIIYAVIINPKAGETFGGKIATPLIKEIAEKIVTYRGIPRESDLIIDHSGTIPVKKPELIIIGDTLPDLTGYSKKELLPLVENEKIKTIITGEGWVVDQNPSPGTVITEGMIITLELK